MRLHRILVLAPALFWLASCGGGGGSTSAPTSLTTPKSALALQRFSDCDAYKSYYSEALSKEFLTGFWGGIPCWSCVQPMGAVGAPSAVANGYHASGQPVPPGSAAGAPVPGSMQSTGAATATLSQTNTQEPGVDEADMIEADPATGRFYAIPDYGELLTFNAIPAEQAQISSRTALSEPISGLYLDSDAKRLVSVGGGYGGIMFAGPAMPVVRYGGSSLTFYDLSDPDHPTATNRYEIAGAPIDSRRIGHRIHLVTNFPLWPPQALSNDQSFWDLLYNQYLPALQKGDQQQIDQLSDQIKQKVSDAVTAADISELLPSYRLGLDNPPSQVLACTDVMRPQVDERLGLIVISSIDSDGSALMQTGAINNAWQVYASADHLFLTQSSGGWWFDPKQTQQTAIYRFALSDTDAAVPDGHGVVDGWVLNSYSMSEKDNFLRIVTTASSYDQDKNQLNQTNHLFVLGTDDQGELTQTGAVRDFVQGEQVYSARFLGDRGYVVTFHQIDPLFAFDLSDPTAPRLAGSLKVPGVSTYLYPYADDRLVTIGRLTDDLGHFTGQLQLQMFDVGDLANPGVIGSTVLGDANAWAWSVAEYDPHAFTLAGDVLSLPVQFSGQDSSDAFSGFIAYHLSHDGGFTELARIDHKEVPTDSSGSGCPPDAGAPPTGAGGTVAVPPCGNFAPVYYNQPLRSVIQTDTNRTVLFTLSDAFLKADDVTATPPTELVSVPLRDPNSSGGGSGSGGTGSGGTAPPPTPAPGPGAQKKNPGT
jgi:hypothetical protein